MSGDGTRGDTMLVGRTLAALTAIGRTGADNFELEDSGNDPVIAWWASADYGQQRITSERFPYPAQAVEDLCSRLINGGQCTKCGRTTVFGVAIEGYCSMVLAALNVDDEDSYRYIRSCEATSARRAAEGDTVVDGGDQPFAVRTVGPGVEGRARTELPTKQPGRHRWIAIASYALTDGQAAAADSGSQVSLKPGMIWSLTVGCIDCEGEFHRCRMTRCDAEAYE